MSYSYQLLDANNSLSSEQNWFLVKIVFQIVCGAGDHKPQFDEQIRIIQATTPTAATNKARQLVLDETSTYEWIKWKLVAITDVYPFHNLLDGAELFSQVTEVDHEAAFIYTQQLKEKNLENRQLLIYH
jgi:hypothetical protein